MHFATLSKTLTHELYVPKSSSCRNFGKSPFNLSCSLTVLQSGLQFELLTKFLKGVLRLTENFQKIISNGVPF